MTKEELLELLDSKWMLCDDETALLKKVATELVNRLPDDPEPELKPCPFCGSNPVAESAMGEFWVHCQCQAMRGNMESAIKAWNQRA